jgi:arylsulfatase A-like enzyme
MPTALAAARIQQEPVWRLEGQNLLPLLKGDAGELPPRYLHWRLNVNWAIRDREWKLVNMNGKHRLFRITTDMGETKDLSKEHPEIAQRLQREMDRWDAQNEPARWGWNKAVCDHFIGYRQFKTEADLHRAQQRKKK